MSTADLDMPPGVTRVSLSLTREEIAIRQLARAADRMRRLEEETELAFPEWVKAQAEMESVGLVCDIQLKPGIAAALSSWKQTQAGEAGRAVAREDAHDDR